VWPIRYSVNWSFRDWKQYVCISVQYVAYVHRWNSAAATRTNSTQAATRVSAWVARHWCIVVSTAFSRGLLTALSHLFAADTTTVVHHFCARTLPPFHLFCELFPVFHYQLLEQPPPDCLYALLTACVCRFSPGLELPGVGWGGLRSTVVVNMTLSSSSALHSVCWRELPLPLYLKFGSRRGHLVPQTCKKFFQPSGLGSFQHSPKLPS